jgi:L-amino acid N-acyltransferase YncA
MISAKPDYDGFTLYFAERSKEVSLEPMLDRLPAGITLVQRDEQSFAKSFDYESTLRAFGTAEKVMEQTRGVMLFEGETLACEAATGAPTRGHIEVGVTTAESHRQRGLAAIACASLVRECEARGYSTWWDCAKQNLPSVKLARKLGYVNGREYRYVWWAKRQI